MILGLIKEQKQQQQKNHTGKTRSTHTHTHTHQINEMSKQKNSFMLGRLP